MLIPDEIRKCVVFICATLKSGLRPVGTAFLYATPIAGSNGYWVDLVTARHVLDGIKKHSVDQRVLLRVNTTGGGCQMFETRLDQWVTHSSADVDVAVLTFSAPAGLDVRFLVESHVATKEVIDKYRIGIGDDLFITGLFVNHFGAERNVPIVRVGNIAATPGEPVDTAMGPMEAYLIEARSIGGLSGSPVFVYLDTFRKGAGPKGSILFSTGEGPAGGEFFLLGLVHGHYHVSVPASGGKADGLGDEAINMGIAIVVPVARILETVNQPERVAMRRAAAEQLEQARGSGPAGPSG